MKRFGKILCGFGSLEFIGAAVALFIFEHLPFPWGMGTLPGGLHAVGEYNPIETEMNLQVHILGFIFSLAVVGLLFLLVGGAAYLLALLKAGLNRLGQR